MTEFWVSQAKHWCKVCERWVSGHARSIKLHEDSKFHKENAKIKDREMRQRKRDQDQEEASTVAELARMERAAHLAVYGTDEGCLPVPEGSSSSSSSGAGPGPPGGGGGSSSAAGSSGRVGDWDPHAPPGQRGEEASRNDGDGGGERKPPKMTDAELAAFRKRRELVARLKKDWVELQDFGSGVIYYMNLRTMERQPQRPRGLEDEEDFARPACEWLAIASAKKEEGGDADAAPETYYYNYRTGKSEWEKPADFVSLEESRKIFAQRDRDMLDSKRNRLRGADGKPIAGKKRRGADGDAGDGNAGEEAPKKKPRVVLPGGWEVVDESESHHFAAKAPAADSGADENGADDGEPDAGSAKKNAFAKDDRVGELVRARNTGLEKEFDNPLAMLKARSEKEREIGREDLHRETNIVVTKASIALTEKDDGGFKKKKIGGKTTRKRNRDDDDD
eukprot:gene201-34_t